jgi:hypothetical protein
MQVAQATQAASMTLDLPRDSKGNLIKTLRPGPIGKLAYDYYKVSLPLVVCKSASGYYLGTVDDGGPVTRESNEYWRKEESARYAFENHEWTQKDSV